jgi:hypothetical protein
VRIQAVTEALQHIYGPMAEARTCVWPAAQQSHRRTRPRPATHIARKPFRPATELMA